MMGDPERTRVLQRMPGSLSPAPPVDEGDIVRRVRDGDPDAFELLFLSYAALLCSYANRFVRSHAEAEELVHDVFIRIWERRAGWWVHDSVGAYLHGAVRKRAANHARRCTLEDEWAQRAAASSSGSDAADSAITAGPDAVHARDLADAAAVAIHRLPPRCREIYLLHRCHGLSYSEVATRLGLAPKTIENQVARALRLLRVRLSIYLM
jgi:RNA polymerase sigma-70 factor (family 1)